MNEIEARLGRVALSNREHANKVYDSFRSSGVTRLTDLAAITSELAASMDSRDQASWLLVALGPKKRVGELLLRLLERCEPSTRAIAARHLGSLGYKNALPALIQAATEDRDLGTRENAVLGLRLHCISRSDHDDRCFRALLKIAQDADEAPRVRAPAIEALVDFARPEAVEPLLEALDSPSALIRFWAIYALAEHEVHEVVPRLTTIAGTDFEHVEGMWSVAEEARWALHRLRTGSWPQELWDRLEG